MNKIKNYKIGYLISHPIQYQVPLYQYINKKSNFDFEVFFLSGFSISWFINQLSIYSRVKKVKEI